MCNLLRYSFALVVVCWQFQVQAAEMRFPGLLPGGGAVTKQIVSMREARYVDMVAQKTDFSCGAAALATVLRYGYGMPLDENAVLRGLLQLADPDIVREKGFSLLDLKNYVRLHGMRAHGYRVNIDALRTLKIPVIALIDIKGYQHFVVVKKVESDKVHVADPALGQKVLSVDQFAEAWNGVVVAVVGREFDEQSPLLDPSDPPSVRKQYALNRAGRMVDPIDFGLIPVDLF
jgi:predicted double-glycine peptidase